MPWYHLSSPRRVAATSHRVTCGIRRPYRPRRMPRRSVCCSGVLFPRPVLRGSHLPALSWSRLSRYFSPSWHLFALIVAGFSPLVKSLARRPPSHAESVRKFDKTALPAHDRLPDFPSARRPTPAVPDPARNTPCLIFRKAPGNRGHSQIQNTRRFRAGCIFHFYTLTENRRIIRLLRWCQAPGSRYPR